MTTRGRGRKKAAKKIKLRPGEGCPRVRREPETQWYDLTARECRFIMGGLACLQTTGEGSRTIDRLGKMFAAFAEEAPKDRKRALQRDGSPAKYHGQKGHIRCPCGHLDSMHRVWDPQGTQSCRMKSCVCEQLQPPLKDDSTTKEQ